MPATADVPDTTVDWDLVYERGGDGAEASGTTPFTVLPVVVPNARSDSAATTSTVPTSSAPTGVDGTAWVWDDSDLRVLVLDMIALAGISLPFRRRSLRWSSRNPSRHLPQAEPGRAVARGFSDAAGHAEDVRR